MSGPRSGGAALADMLDACERIASFTADVADEEIVSPGSQVRSAVLHELTVLGEAAKHVPSTVTDEHPDIPWSEMARMRDKIVHYYFGLDDALLVSIVRESVTRVAEALRDISG